MPKLDRRTLLFSGVAALGLSASGYASAQVPVRRRSVGAMTPDDPDLAAYRRAILAMRALPESDPRNWTRQARIHNQFCPHGNWYFLPWHRAYLVAFENICRELSGKQDFALPFWDWTADRNLPSFFTSGTPESNPFNYASRSVGAADSLDDETVGPLIIARILDAPDFEAFGSGRPIGQNSTAQTWLSRKGDQGEFEGNTHNGVHVWIGGSMSTFMSPLDPIFWLHHCNIDRLWAAWNASGRQNSADRNWLGMSFAGMFVDGGRRPFAPDVAALGTTGAFGYAYPGEVIKSASLTSLDRKFALWRGAAGTTARNLVAGGPALNMIREEGVDVARVNAVSASGFSSSFADASRPLSASLQLGSPLGEFLGPIPQSPAGTLQRPPEVQQRVIATLVGLVPPVDRRTRLRVFVDCPYLSPRIGATDRHYAGAVNFFGTATDHAGHGGTEKISQTIDLTATLARLYPQASVSPTQINVQLITSSSAAKELKETAVMLDRVSVAVF